MTEFVNLRIITPDKEFYNEQIVKLNTESVEGKIGILPNHIPLIAVLKPTISEIVTVKGEKKTFFSSTGVLKVTKKEVIMLCDACEWPENIEVERAKKSKERAEKRLKQKKDIDSIDVDRAKLSILRALMRIKIK
ncbi:F0F1 ATP synthase subunit epsilon [Clostridium sp. ZS2-4]|uniref:F0F1 ATP synthase subunit epsilon n=1 Tax=Clostridium sp. ZS2-4 TaxID=2987703 RepID=UPI00227BFFC4|nr:F0F1 ATP synthase subunit epsilon [Clostridium sp. ZS2-4]MCY6355477.1 F0F1 ATP synthase subunit epsilon [Clostridium sp. ZS2-4]